MKTVSIRSVIENACLDDDDETERLLRYSLIEVSRSGIAAVNAQLMALHAPVDLTEINSCKKSRRRTR